METIVIIGGGFAGMNLAKRLDADKYTVKLIDRNNFNTFPPLFYQVASSVVGTPDICFPFRQEFRRRRNFTYHMGHVKAIDLNTKTVSTSYETLHYDRLVIAAGTRNNYFGMPGLDEETFGIKTVAEAAHTRDEIIDRLERGALCPDPKRRQELLSFLVVGGGPSGVEIAGALGEMKKYIVPREYPELNPDEIRLTLIEGSPRLLGAMSERSSAKALEYLQGLMVDVRLNTALRGYKDKQVTFGDGHTEYWETLIWTAGITGEPMPGLPSELVGRGGRILTDEYCRVKGVDDLFAIGDIALCQTPEAPNGFPQVAQPAIQQARCLARNLNHGAFTEPFRYKDKGSMATVGKRRAVAELPGMFFSGSIAWLGWLLIHLLSLLGMRNKISVLMSWMWNYVSASTSLRLLLRPTRYPLRRHWGD